MAHILVADDEAAVRDICRRLLEKAGHEVTEAGDGDIALKLYRQRPADLVIVDILMPGKEGLETITELRREFPDTRIIAISGGGMIGPDQYLHVARKLGADRVFEKPFYTQELLAAVTELIQEGPAAD